MTEAQANGTYLYAVASEFRTPEEAFGSLEGIKGSRVYTVRDGGLMAVVSDLPTDEELRPERRNVAAHQKVLETAIDASQVVLPVAFGTVADSADGIRGLLERYHDDLEAQLERVKGREQMSLRVVYSGAGTIFDFLVASTPELKAARDALATGTPTREEKIDLGQRFEAALSTFRDEVAGRLEEALGDRCAALKRLDPRSEQELARFACLVDTKQREAWRDAVTKAGTGLPDFVTVEEGGPYPPYDFVDLHLQA